MQTFKNVKCLVIGRSNKFLYRTADLTDPGLTWVTQVDKKRKGSAGSDDTTSTITYFSLDYKGLQSGMVAQPMGPNK